MPFSQRRLKIVGGPADVLVLGSDVRTKGACGRCALCVSDGPLQLSHIAPRWAFRWLKAEGGIVGTVKSLSVEYADQDGNKHYLLCAACEQRLGHAEAYLAVLSRGQVNELADRGVTMTPGPFLHGVDANLVRRGVLGVLLKAHFAPSPPFAGIALDARFLGRLRQRLLTDDYPTLAFPLIGTKWLGCIIEGANPRASVVPAYRHASFDLMMGGWSWSVILKRQSGHLEGLPPDCNLTKGQPWRVLLGDVAISNWYVENWTGEEIDYDVDPWIGYDRAAPCPCGLVEYTFGDCCADTWCS